MYTHSEFTGVYTLPLPQGFKITALRVVGSISPPGPTSKTGIASTIWNWKTNQWVHVDIGSGNPIADPARYIGPGNLVRITVVNNQPGVQASVRCGIAAEAKRQ